MTSNDSENNDNNENNQKAINKQRHGENQYNGVIMAMKANESNVSKKAWRDAIEMT